MSDAFGRCNSCHDGQCCGLVGQLRVSLKFASDEHGKADSECDQLRANLAAAEARAATEHATHDALLLEVSSYRSGMIAADERLATVTAERDEHAKHRANLDRKFQKAQKQEHEWYETWRAERDSHSETRKALETAMRAAEIGAALCESTRAELESELEGKAALVDDLATVTAELKAANADRRELAAHWQAEIDRHGRTRISLDKMEDSCAVAQGVYDRQTAVLESTRADLANAEAELEKWNNGAYDFLTSDTLRAELSALESYRSHGVKVATELAELREGKLIVEIGAVRHVLAETRKALKEAASDRDFFEARVKELEEQHRLDQFVGRFFDV